MSFFSFFLEPAKLAIMCCLVIFTEEAKGLKMDGSGLGGHCTKINLELNLDNLKAFRNKIGQSHFPV